jgi:hypothetical protein
MCDWSLPAIYTHDVITSAMVSDTDMRQTAYQLTRVKKIFGDIWKGPSQLVPLLVDTYVHTEGTQIPRCAE